MTEGEQPSLKAQRLVHGLFGNPHNLAILLDEPVTHPFHIAARKGIATLGIHDAIEFTRIVLHGLGSDTPFWNRNSRSAVLSVFRSIPLNKIPPTELLSMYISTVAGLSTKANSRGPVDSLLEAGEMIVPHLDLDEKLGAKERILTTWSDVWRRLQDQKQLTVVSKKHTTIVEPNPEMPERSTRKTEPRKTPHHVIRRRSEVKDLFTYGFSQNEIAELYNLSQQTIRRDLAALRKRDELPPKEKKIEDVVYQAMQPLVVNKDLQKVMDSVNDSEDFQWDNVPPETILHILKIVGVESHKKSTELKEVDFQKEFIFAGGKNVVKLHTFLAEQSESDNPVREYIQKTEMSSAIIADIQQGSDVQWENVPNNVIRNILARIVVNKLNPVYTLREDDFHRPQPLLKGKNLDSLYEYAETDKKREGEDVVNYLFNKIDMTNEVIKDLRMDKHIFWSKLHDSIILNILEKAAEEVGVPLRFLGERNLKNTEFNFLKGNNLKKLYNYFERLPERIADEKKILPYMFDKINAPEITANDVIARIVNKKKIPWGIIPDSVKRDLLFKAATELGVPVSSMTMKDFMSHPYNFLEGNTLKSLYQTTLKDPQRAGQPIIPYLLEKINADKISAEEIAQLIIQDKRIEWNRIPDNVKRDLLKKAAFQLKKKAYYLRPSDFLEPLDFLEGDNLYNLYQAYQDKKPDEQTDVIPYMFESIDMMEEVMKDKRDGQTISWGKVPRFMVTHMLQRAASELENPIPASIIEGYDLKGAHSFLDGNTLEDMISFGISLKIKGDRRKRTGIGSLLEYAGLEPNIDDTITAIIRNRNITRSGLPPTVLHQLLQRCATELQIPLDAVGYRTLSRSRFSFLNGRTLENLAFYFDHISKTGNLPLSLEVYQLGGYKTGSDDEVRSMYKRRIFVPKDEISPALETSLLSEAVRHLRKYSRILNIANVLHTPMPFLDGQTLYPLYQAIVAPQEDITQSSFAPWLESVIGEPPSKGRSGNKLEKITDTYNGVFHGEVLKPYFEVDKKKRFIGRIASDYFADIKHTGVSQDALNTSVYKELDSYLRSRKNSTIAGITSHMHTFLEKYKQEHLAKWYQQRTLALPVTGDGSETVADVIRLDDLRGRRTIFDSRLHERQQRLSPLQRDLVNGIVQSDKTFEDMLPTVQTRYGGSLDETKLHELYEDALVLLLPPERQSAA